MKKMRFYILFSEELDRPFTSFKQFTDLRTFSIMDDGDYGKFANLRKMTLFKTKEEAQEEKDHMLEYMEKDTEREYRSYHFSQKDFDVINKLKIVEFISHE